MNGSNFGLKKEMDFGCLLFCLAGMSSAMRWNSFNITNVQELILKLKAALKIINLLEKDKDHH